MISSEDRIFLTSALGSCDKFYIAEKLRAMLYKPTKYNHLYSRMKASDGKKFIHSFMQLLYVFIEEEMSETFVGHTLYYGPEGLFDEFVDFLASDLFDLPAFDAISDSSTELFAEHLCLIQRKISHVEDLLKDLPEVSSHTEAHIERVVNDYLPTLRRVSEKMPVKNQKLYESLRDSVMNLRQTLAPRKKAYPLRKAIRPDTRHK